MKKVRFWSVKTFFDGLKGFGANIITSLISLLIYGLIVLAFTFSDSGTVMFLSFFGVILLGVFNIFMFSYLLNKFNIGG